MTNDEATALAVTAFAGKPDLTVHGPFTKDGQVMRHVAYTAGTAPLVRSAVSFVGDKLDREAVEASIAQASLCMGPPVQKSMPGLARD